MGHEIERKSLVDKKLWRPSSAGAEYVQGYLSTDIRRTVRVRIAGDKAFLTIKGEARGVTRPEFEYAIPVSDARAMLELCDKPYISKTRHVEQFAGNCWEIDVFHGDNEGLVMAELEVPAEDYAFETPGWVREEVSADARYYNSNLLKFPFREW
jgi:adenylate cyclase